MWILIITVMFQPPLVTYIDNINSLRECKQMAKQHRDGIDKRTQIVYECVQAKGMKI